jgi:hypothetical protein
MSAWSVVILSNLEVTQDGNAFLPARVEQLIGPGSRDFFNTLCGIAPTDLQCDNSFRKTVTKYYFRTDSSRGLPVWKQTATRWYLEKNQRK